jgi:hypothetical protein
MFALSGLAIFGMALGLLVVLVLLSGVRDVPNAGEKNAGASRAP